LALVTLLAAGAKAWDVDGFAAILGDHQIFLPALLKPIALGLVVLEFIMGLWLLTGRLLAEAAWMTMIVHLVYGLWSAGALWRGLKLANCGFLGTIVPQPLTWITVAQDGGMALAALVLYLATRRR
jgi:hypothetical protein